jgi:oligosaccharyltransferase complex subunit beta
LTGGACTRVHPLAEVTGRLCVALCLITGTLGSSPSPPPNACPLVRHHSGQHTAIVTSEVATNPRVVGMQPIAPVVFRGVGHTVDKDNILAVPVLSGASSSYSATLTKELPASGSSLELAGKRLGLITAVQGRNNARAVFSGSLDFFSDEFFGATLKATGKVSSHWIFCWGGGGTRKSYLLLWSLTFALCPSVRPQQTAGNKALALELSKWALGERGILRASNITHHRADG